MAEELMYKEMMKAFLRRFHEEISEGLEAIEGKEGILIYRGRSRVGGTSVVRTRDKDIWIIVIEDGEIVANILTNEIDMDWDIVDGSFNARFYTDDYEHEVYIDRITGYSVERYTDYIRIVTKGITEGHEVEIDIRIDPEKKGEGWLEKAKKFGKEALPYIKKGAEIGLKVAPLLLV